MKAFLAIISGFVLTLAVFVSGLAVAAWFLAAEPVQQPSAGVEVADLWTREPRTVNTPVVGLERLPARPARPDPQIATQPADAAQNAAAITGASVPVDATTTASIDPAQEAAPRSALADEPLDMTPLGEAITGAPQPAADDPQEAVRTLELSAAQVEAHVEWCASRYRSYDPSNNSYRPFSGGIRPCVSPHLEDAVAAADSAAEANAAPAAINAAAGGPADEAAATPELGYASADQGGDLQMVSDDHIAYCFSRYRSYRPEDNTYQPYGGGPRRQCE